MMSTQSVGGAQSARLASMIGLCFLMAFPTVGWLCATVVGVIVVTTVYSGIEYFVQNWKCLWD